jgi:hypothetical protein
MSSTSMAALFKLPLQPLRLHLLNKWTQNWYLINHRDKVVNHEPSLAMTLHCCSRPEAEPETRPDEHSIICSSPQRAREEDSALGWTKRDHATPALCRALAQDARELQPGLFTPVWKKPSLLKQAKSTVIVPRWTVTWGRICATGF